MKNVIRIDHANKLIVVVRIICTSSRKTKELPSTTNGIFLK